MANIKISLMTAASSANLTGVALVETTDKNVATVKVTYAQLRTALFAGGTGYAANDPLTIGGTLTVTAGGLTVSSGTSAFQAVTVAGNLSVAQPTSGGNAWAIDNSQGSTSSGISLVDGAQFNLGANNSFAGLVLVQSTTVSADWAIVFLGGSAGSSIVAQSAALFSIGIGSASKINVGYSINQAMVENKTGVTRNISITPIRTRASF